MVDEVQDFSPLELAVLLDSTTKERSVTLAGDTAQAIAPDHGFSTWTELLDFLGIAHERVEPLRVSYRSTREIVDVRRARAGAAAGRRAAGGAARRRAGRVVRVRVGGRVRASSCRTRSRSWCATSPTRRWRCSPATPSRRGVYYEALHARRGAARCGWSPTRTSRSVAGIDVTDVRQTKGLEFDIVILLDVNDASYPTTDDARRLLHVAMTRAAHQLWVTYTGAPSPLLPDSLR